jgi:hypothetical protein
MPIVTGSFTATASAHLRSRIPTSESRRREITPSDLPPEEWRAVLRQILGDAICRRLGLVQAAGHYTSFTDQQQPRS